MQISTKRRDTLKQEKSTVTIRDTDFGKGKDLKDSLTDYIGVCIFEYINICNVLIT